jgi:hypothetical protein
MRRIAFVILLALTIPITPLAAFSISSTTGFAIPFGTWAQHHASSPFLSLGLDPYQKRFLSIGVALEMASFRGKLNSEYHLQIISPGAAVKLYPLFFMGNRSIFFRETLTYSFMQRKVHDAVEKGRDVGMLSTLGFQIPIAERWNVIPYLGEKHYLGGVEMFIVGLEVAYKR